MKLTKKDMELIDIATRTLKENCDIYEDIANHVCCALRAKSGNIYVGMNLKTSPAVCAEQVAIGQAFAYKEREFSTIVAVKMNKDGTPGIVSPCGLCRYIFNKLKLDMNVIVLNKKSLNKVKTKDLLPYAYETATDRKTK